jgi:hypothetical protein
MLRYFDHWVNFAKRYESTILNIIINIASLTDYLEVNDLTVKGNFTFYKDYIRFTGKSSINTIQDSTTGVGNIIAMNNYQLEIRFSPLSNLILTQLGSGALNSEGEFNIWQDDKKEHNLSIYKHCSIDENFLVASTVQLLYNFRNNYLINLGIRGIELYSYKNKRLDPGLFSLGGIAKLYEDANMTTWGGIHINLKPKKIDNVSVLLGMSNPYINGIMRLNIERKENLTVETLTADLPTKTTVVTPTSTTVIFSEPYYYENELRMGFESKVQDDLSLFSTMIVKQDKSANLIPSFVGGGMYIIDPTTNIRFKANDDLVATLSLTKRLRKMIDFTFATSFNYKKPLKETQLGSIKTKFGLSVNFLDEFMV